MFAFFRHGNGELKIHIKTEQRERERKKEREREREKMRSLEYKFEHIYQAIQHSIIFYYLHLHTVQNIVKKNVHGLRKSKVKEFINIGD